MSRAYTIRVSADLTRTVVVGDCVTSQLELLGLLPPEQMGALVGEALEQRGFTVEEGTAVREEPDNLRISVELATGTVTISLRDEEEVHVEAERVGRATSPTNTGALASRVQADLENELETRSRVLQTELTARLEAHLANVRQELNQAVNAATAEALKRRAAQIGTVREIHEDPETGSVTIKVEI